MEGEDLYSDFGPEFGDGGDGKTQTMAADEPQVAGAAIAGAAAAGARPPLVTVPAGAADLYGDLFDSEGGGGSTLLKTQVVELTNRVQQQEVQLGALQQEVEKLTLENGELGGRCATLANNISALYNTAKLELQRKDTEIRELRERLAAAPGSSRGRPPAPVVPGRPVHGTQQQSATLPAGRPGAGDKAPADMPAVPPRQAQQPQEQPQRRQEPQQARSDGRADRSSSGHRFQQASGNSGRRDVDRRHGDQRHEPGRSTPQHDRSSGEGAGGKDGDERRLSSGRWG